VFKFLLGVVATLLPYLALAQIPEQAKRYHRDLLREAKAVWGINAPIALFAGQIHQESRWREDARSRAGAVGLGQFMPATAKWISGAYPEELGLYDYENPRWALRALVRYDRHLWERVRTYASDCDRFLFALSDYNGGSGWRMKRQRLSMSPGDFAPTSVINPGIRPANQKENQEYPLRIVYRWQPLYASWGVAACQEG